MYLPNTPGFVITYNYLLNHPSPLALEIWKKSLFWDPQIWHMTSLMNSPLSIKQFAYVT